MGSLCVAVSETACHLWKSWFDFLVLPYFQGKKVKNADRLSPGKDESCQANEEDFQYMSALSIIEKILQDNSLPSYNSK
jgi:hypothetical protein